MMLQVAVLSVLFLTANSFVIQGTNDEEYSGSNLDNDELTVSTLIEKANRDIGDNLDDLQLIYGDVAVPTNLQNAHPCTLRGPVRGCLWPKSRDGMVYVPFRISNEYSRRQRDTILRSMRSFANITCIRFTPYDRQRDFLDIKSREGCFSFAGRRGRNQTLSLNRQGCVFNRVIKHELLHALGFLHEQSRSDRDEHVRIQLQNVRRGMESQFRIEQTNNLNTPYDYNSIMHYDRYAFSRNREPTIVPIPDESVPIGRATDLSPIDIRRVNVLYDCNSAAPEPEPAQGDIFL